MGAVSLPACGVPNSRTNRLPTGKQGLIPRYMRGSSLNITYTEGKLPVTKVDAAVRQLETAIKLWFSDGDPVAVCTLSFAAYEILYVLSKDSRKEPALMDMDSVRPEYQEAMQAEFRADPNFCKHTAKDPHEVRYLTVRNHPVIILDAIRMYKCLGLAERPIFHTFQSWLWLSMPDIFVKRPQDVLGDRVNIASILVAGKQAYYNHALPGFARKVATAR